MLAATRVPLNVNQRRGQFLLSALEYVTPAAGEQRVSVAGAELTADLGNPSERLLYYATTNVVEWHRRDELYSVLTSLSRTSGVFVDVGANLGIFSLLARRHGLDAVLFEPERRHAVFLERNASAFGIVRPWALSDTSGTATFFVAGSHNLAASSLAPPGSDAEQALYESKTTVEVETFDGALSRVGVDPAEVALIKVDVEGNEARTVRGMSDYLSNHAAPVWCEVRGPSSTRSRSSYEPVIAVMEAHGYRPHTSERGRPEAFRDHESSEVFDLLFLKRR